MRPPLTQGMRTKPKKRLDKKPSKNRRRQRCARQRPLRSGWWPSNSRTESWCRRRSVWIHRGLKGPSNGWNAMDVDGGRRSIAITTIHAIRASSIESSSSTTTPHWNRSNCHHLPRLLLWEAGGIPDRETGVHAHSVDKGSDAAQPGDMES